MSNFDEIRQVRLAKLQLLKEKGIDPYPAVSNTTHTLSSLKEGFVQLEADKAKVVVAGRVMSFRSQGGLIFFDLFDGTAKFQMLLKKNEDGSNEDIFSLFNNTVDIGDFVEVTGTLFVTKREVQTVEVASWRMLSKSLRPLPEKWAGLQDVEERFRRRYLDALMSDEVRERFVTRSKIISIIRNTLDAAAYLEVETPSLQPLYGGASAEPFTTHHNALDIDLYLRISPELYLKRMMAAGFPKVYEIARNFRNEGIDMTHNPEFTMVEWYEAYSDYKKQMAFVESMFKDIVKGVHGGKAFTSGENEIDVSKPFKVISYFDLIKEYGKLENPENISIEDLGAHAKTLGVEVTKADSKAKILDNIYKKTARPLLIQPTFIVDYPADYLPLAKKSKENPQFVEAFQLVIAGVELVKAFSELNDPLDQLARFEEQEKNKKGGEKDAQSLDTDFIEAMEYGIPPAGGVGIGIDRLVMVLTDTHNIKEVIFFPTMRPRD